MKSKKAVIKKNNNNKKQNRSFNDLLVPLMLIIIVMPLIMRMAVYDSGLDKYLWYGEDGLRSDLYSYYKARFFVVIVIFMAAILFFRMFLYKEKNKSVKVFIPLFVYGLLALISAMFSDNLKSAFRGNADSFESIFVVIGYIVAAFYAYQILESESDYKFIWKCFLTIQVVMIILGFFQIFKMDPLNYEWAKKLVMTGEQYKMYGDSFVSNFSGNNVELTLANPNYAAAFLVMMFAVAFVMFFTEKKRKMKSIYGVISLLLVVMIWFTYTRAAFVAISVGAVVFALMVHKTVTKKMWISLAAAVSVISLVLAGLDGINDFKYLRRIVDKKEEVFLQNILTKDDKIEVKCDNELYEIYLEAKKHDAKMNEAKNAESPGKDNESDNTMNDDEMSDNLLVVKKNGKIIKTAGSGGVVKLSDKKKFEVSFYDSFGDEIMMIIDDDILTFSHDDEGYWFNTIEDKKDRMVDIEAVDFKGLEYLGSGRGYIWSRTLPQLKDKLIIGSGPDTFVEVFPQNDYVGKIIYSHSPFRIIEKGHNDYLTKAVQSGVLSAIMYVVFLGIFIYIFIKKYSAIENFQFKHRLGLGSFVACVCYMAEAMFTDSTLAQSPLFFVLIGMALSSVWERDDETFGIVHK